MTGQTLMATGLTDSSVSGLPSVGTSCASWSVSPCPQAWGTAAAVLCGAEPPCQRVPSALSELILSNIHVSATGEWECAVSTAQGNVSKKVEIVVLETSASYCPAERVSNNRGDFRWEHGQGAQCVPGAGDGGLGAINGRRGGF